MHCHKIVSRKDRLTMAYQYDTFDRKYCYGQTDSLNVYTYYCIFHIIPNMVIWRVPQLTELPFLVLHKLLIIVLWFIFIYIIYVPYSTWSHFLRTMRTFKRSDSTTRPVFLVLFAYGQPMDNTLSDVPLVPTSSG